MESDVAEAEVQEMTTEFDEYEHEIKEILWELYENKIKEIT